MALRDNMLAYYDLDEASGNRTDDTGNGYTLVDGNTVGSISDGGITVADFEKDNSEYLYIDSNMGASETSDFSVNMFVKYEALPLNNVFQQHFYRVVKNGTAGNQMWIDFYNSSGTYYIRLGVGDSTGNVLSYTWTPSADTWYMVTATYDYNTTGGLKLYINGSSVGTPQNTGTYGGAGSMASQTNIGRYRDGNGNVLSRYLDGRMKFLGCWGKVLSTDEITSLYNSGSGLNYAGTESGTTYNQTVTASATMSPSLAKTLTFVKTLSDTIDATVSMVRATSLFRAISATATATATMLRGSAYAKDVIAVVTATASITSDTIKGVLMTITATGTATLTKLATLSQILSATATGTAVIEAGKFVSKVLAVTATASLVIVKGFIYTAELAVTAIATATIPVMDKVLGRILSVTATAWVKLKESFWVEKYERQDDDYHIKY